MENKDLKQTAVEWLINELHKKQQGLTITSYNHIFDKAKEMEKQQHKDTWFESTSQFDNAAEMTYKKEFEQYYNETFKKA